MGLRIHPGKTKVLSNQSSLRSETKKEMEVDDINTDKRRKREILGPTDYIPATGNDRNQESNQGFLGDVQKVQTRADIKNYLLKPRLRLVDAAITPTMCYASGTWAPTKEHERMLQTAQRKMLRLIIQTKRRYKKIVKHKVKNSEDINDIDSSCTNDESEDGKSDTSQNDQDSDVSFEIDSNEEIDAAEVEEGGMG